MKLFAKLASPWRIQIALGVSVLLACLALPSALANNKAYYQPFSTECAVSCEGSLEDPFISFEKIFMKVIYFFLSLLIVSVLQKGQEDLEVVFVGADSDSSTRGSRRETPTGKDRKLPVEGHVIFR